MRVGESGANAKGHYPDRIANSSKIRVSGEMDSRVPCKLLGLVFEVNVRAAGSNGIRDIGAIMGTENTEISLEPTRPNKQVIVQKNICVCLKIMKPRAVKRQCRK